MKAEHTSGSWESFTSKEHGQFRIADAETAQVTIGWAYKAEDAQLIAAAPELLEALKSLLNYENLSAYERADTMKAAKAAIAKTTR